MQKVDEAIRQLNLMADAADEIERQYADGVASREAMRQQRELAKASRLTWSAARPGRVAYKGARRAGMSREEASTASAEALASLKEAKRQQIENFWRDGPATWTLAEVLVPGRWECQSVLASRRVSCGAGRRRARCGGAGVSGLLAPGARRRKGEPA